LELIIMGFYIDTGLVNIIIKICSMQISIPPMISFLPPNTKDLYDWIISFCAQNDSKMNYLDINLKLSKLILISYAIVLYYHPIKLNCNSLKIVIVIKQFFFDIPI